MSEAQWKKVLKDLKGDSEKLIILALMHVPRLKNSDAIHVELQQQLATAITALVEHPHPDISFLARKAANTVSQLNINTSAQKQDQTPEETVPGQEDEEGLIQWLRDVPSSFEDYADIEPCFASDSDRVLSLAIEAYARCAPVKAQLQKLEPFLMHEHNRIRGNAVAAIGCLEPERVHHVLEEMLNTTRLSMRESAVWALSQLPTHPRHQAFLMQCLHDPYRDIRIRAIRSLSNYPDTSTLARLKQLCMDQDIEICEAAQEVLDSLTEGLDPVAQDEKLDSNLPADPLDDDLDEFMEEEETHDSITLESDYLEEPDSGPYLDVQDEEHEGVVDLFATDESPREAQTELPAEPLEMEEDWPEFELHWEESQNEVAESVPEPEPDTQALHMQRRRTAELEHLSEYLQKLREESLQVPWPQEYHLQLHSVSEDSLFHEWFEFECHAILQAFVPEFQPRITTSKPEPSAGPSKKELLRHKEDLQEKIRESLQEAASQVLRIHNNEPMTNAKLQKAAREVEHQRQAFRDYLKASPPQTGENLQKQRRMQVKIQTLMQNLGKLALTEARAKRFQHHAIQKIQDRLSGWIPRLEKVRQRLGNFH